MLEIGTKAPDFAAADQLGKRHQLADYAGRWLLLYFYPKDHTPGCTKEACALRDRYEDFRRLGANVVGVSADSVVSHERFAADLSLPFPLLADGGKEIIKRYGADGLSRRISYLIDPAGQIAQAYGEVRPEEHAAEVVADIERLQRGS